MVVKEWRIGPFRRQDWTFGYSAAQRQHQQQQQPEGPRGLWTRGAAAGCSSLCVSELMMGGLSRCLVRCRSEWSRLAR